MTAADPLSLLAILRAGGSGAADIEGRLSWAPDGCGTDPHAPMRAQVAVALVKALLPTDRPIAAWLLGQEVSAHQAAGRGAADALLGLVAALARFGQPEDALLIWRAHSATPETRDAVDVEHLGRAGVAHVRDWLVEQVRLGGQTARDARSALAWLEAGRASGAFNGLIAYFAWSDEVYGLGTDAPI